MKLPPRIVRTLHDPVWLVAQAERLCACFPEAWTPIADINASQIGDRLRMIGIDWREQRELEAVFGVLRELGIMQVALARDRVTEQCRRGTLRLRPAAVD